MKIVVLAGGVSTERDVSLSSGRMIYHALKKKEHQVMMLDVYLGLNEMISEEIFHRDCDWSKDIGNVGVSNPDLEQIKKLRKNPETGFFGPGVIELCRMADMVFVALHGENGENGKLQATFDLLNIRYTGTDYVSSALSMDKGLTKELFAFHNIPMPKGITKKKLDPIEHFMQYPLVVKVCCGGSSVGVYIVEDEEAYEKAMKEAFTFDEEVIVEEYIKGREFSVGVMEGKALPIIEIAPLEGFYNYKNKYQAGSAIETCPANLSEEVTKEMQRIAEEVFCTLRLETYARMDFLLRGETEIFCLEANTLPGMTLTSLLPQEAQAIGVDFPDLCEWILNISLKKYQ
jgi:D-alanine-D-alanine ligase